MKPILFESTAQTFATNGIGKLYGQIEENKLSIEFVGTFTDAILYLTSGHLDIKMNDDRTRTYDGFTSAVSVQRGLKPNYTNVVLERVTA